MSHTGITDISSNDPQIPTQFDTDSGSAVPIGNMLTIDGETQPNGTFTKPLWTTGSGSDVNINIQLGAAITSAPADLNDAGIVSFDDTMFSVDSNGYVQLLGGGSAIDSFTVPTGTSPVVPDGSGNIDITVGSGFTLTGGLNSMAYALDGAVVGQTITGDSGGALSPTAGNWNILGIGDTSTSGTGSTLSIKEAVSSSFIVDANSAYGTHTTIQSAVTAASAGDVIFLRPGTYTENIVVDKGVSIVAFDSDFVNPSVEIVGKISFAVAGTVNLRNIKLTTNADYFLEVTGTASSFVQVENCYISISDNTGISYTTANTDSGVLLINCRGNILANNISYFVATGTGQPGNTDANVGGIRVEKCYFRNSSNFSNTASSSSACQITMIYSDMATPLNCTSTGTLAMKYSVVRCQNLNVTAMAFSGTGVSSISNSEVSSGTAVAVTIDTGSTVSINITNISSSNAVNISGAGTINISMLKFNSGKGNITVSTQNFSPVGPRVEVVGGAQMISGTGSPDTVVTANKGSIFFRTDAATDATRAYINTDGVTAWVNIETGTSAGFIWTEVTGTSQALVAGNGYIANNAGLVTLTLPATAAIGDTIKVTGKGAGLFKISQNASQTINMVASTTTSGTGGSLTAIERYDSLEMICITANNEWNVTNSTGTFTIV